MRPQRAGGIMVGGPVETEDETPRLPPGFDPRKWVFDSRTNEFHKVTDRLASGSLIDSRTYEQRYLAYLLKARQSRRDRIMAAACVAVFLLSLLWASAQSNGSVILALWVFFVIPSGFGVVVGIIGSIYNSAVALPIAKANVGPPPPPRPGREKVEQQKVHGEGGVLGGDRLRQAARGGSLANEGAAPLETYDD